MTTTTAALRSDSNSEQPSHVQAMGHARVLHTTRLRKVPIAARADTTAPVYASVSQTTSTPWKDTDRIAQFVANLAGGCFVVLGVGTYSVRLVRRLAAEAPDLREWIWAHWQVWEPHLVHPCWRLDRAHATQIVQQCTNVLLDKLAQLHLDGSDPVVLWSAGLAVVMAVALAVVMRKYKWIGWFLCLQFIVIIQWFVALYQVVRICFSTVAYSLVKLVKWTLQWSRNVHAIIFRTKNEQAEKLRRSMKQAKTYLEWQNYAKMVDILEDKEAWKANFLPEDQEHCDLKQLQRNVDDLTRAIEERKIDELKYILAAFVMRDKLGIDSPSLHLECSHGTKHIISRYNDLLIKALELLHEAKPDEFSVEEKLIFFRKLKQSFGSTALCLSGGGAIAMYHMGVIKALLEADLLPNVVSGSSGGSIAAAMMACKTNEELLNDIIQNDISTRFIPIAIRWFPPLITQLAHCIKTGFLVECSMFERTTQHYYGEPLHATEKMMYYTFQDAYQKTGRHVCITVSASDITGQKGPKKMLLNHINSPHVLLWSAVAVSCSLPGIMKGKQLMARDHEGNIVPYVSLGKEWMDGSIQHDLPMETMASCFNVTNFIVSQVNPHVVPFVGDEVDKPKFRNSVFHTLESVIAADVRHRLKMLAFLGLFPRIYGHQFSAMFKQNFSGNVTILPDFIFAEAIGIKAILNPTVDDMKRYIQGGQRAVWPKLAFIHHLCRVEKSLDHILHQLLGPEAAPYENWLNPRTKVTPPNLS